MKRKIYTSLAIFICAGTLLSFVPKPFAYTLRAMDPTTAQVASTLEKSTTTLQKGKGNNSTVPAYSISGAKSSTRLKISQAVFQTDSDKSTLIMDPADYLILYKLTTDKNSRSFSISESLIAISFTSIASGTYRVAPSSGLVPGEYAFIDKSTTTADGNFTVWTFGVDQ